MKKLTVEQIERAINVKAKNWEGQCYGISCEIVNAKLVDGHAVYGHWLGPVAKASIFYNKHQSGLPFIQHGWIIVNNGKTLIDPTRWAFEAVKPYIYYGLVSDSRYDEAGNRWREAMTMGKPRPIPTEPHKHHALSGKALRWAMAVLEEQQPAFTDNQLFYLANLPYGIMRNAIGTDGLKQIYEAIANASSTSIAWIPIDNAQRAKRECGFDCDRYYSQP